MLAWTFPADYFTKGIVFTDPQVQVQRQELLDLSSAMGGRNPEGLCPPSDLTRHKAERTVRRLIEEAHREKDCWKSTARSSTNWQAGCCTGWGSRGTR